MPSDHANNHGFQVEFGVGSATPQTYYFASEADAEGFLAILTAPQKLAAALEGPDGNWIVKPGMSIQVAIGAADIGDTISLDAGTYVENITVDKAVSILGANDGVLGTANRGAESIIQGTTNVTAASGTVVIDGIEVLNTSDNFTQFVGITLNAVADVSIVNSLFYSTGPNGNNADRAILITPATSGVVTVDGNLFSGVQQGPAGTFGFSTANWTTAVWSDGTASQLTITGNTFDNVRTGLNLDGYTDSATEVTANTFTNSGSGISLGTPTTSSIVGIHDNTFTDVGSDFNLQNLTAGQGQTFDLAATNNTGGGSGADALLVVLGTQGNDIITGSSAADYLDGNGGIDALTGGTGNDTIDGDGGSDTAIFSGNRGDYAVTRLGPTSYQLMGQDGTDTVNNVEFFTFDDGTLSADAVFNDAPVAGDDAAVATEDGALVTGTVADNDFDADIPGVPGEVLTYTLDSPVAGLTLNPDGSYSFDPCARTVAKYAASKQLSESMRYW